MTSQYDASEAVRFAHDLSRTAREVAPKARQITRKTAFDIERDGKIFAPVLTGFLMNSIGVSFSGNAYLIKAEIGPTADYGLHVEAGTSRMQGQPYMGPATDRHEDPYLEAMAQLGATVVRS